MPIVELQLRDSKTVTSSTSCTDFTAVPSSPDANYTIYQCANSNGTSCTTFATTNNPDDTCAGCGLQWGVYSGGSLIIATIGSPSKPFPTNYYVRIQTDELGDGTPTTYSYEAQTDYLVKDSVFGPQITEPDATADVDIGIFYPYWVKTGCIYEDGCNTYTGNPTYPCGLCASQGEITSCCTYPTLYNGNCLSPDMSGNNDECCGCFEDCLCDTDCNGDCGGTAEYDECGVCDGSGRVFGCITHGGYDCGENTGYCESELNETNCYDYNNCNTCEIGVDLLDCDINSGIDNIGAECGGDLGYQYCENNYINQCKVVDKCGICDGDGTSCMGCNDSSACNYDNTVPEDTGDYTYNDGSCYYNDGNQYCYDGDGDGLGNPSVIGFYCNEDDANDENYVHPDYCTDEDDDCPTNDRDCAGDCGGTAFLDNCDVCSGGNSNHLADSDLDECNVCFGEQFDLLYSAPNNDVEITYCEYMEYDCDAIFDDCMVPHYCGDACDNDSNLPVCVSNQCTCPSSWSVGCDGVCRFTPAYTDCNQICCGGDTGIDCAEVSTNCFDDNGDGVCIGGNTGLQCVQDCAYEWYIYDGDDDDAINKIDCNGICGPVNNQQNSQDSTGTCCLSVSILTYYLDQDGDGKGDPCSDCGVLYCAGTQPDNWVPNQLDNCDEYNYYIDACGTCIDGSQDETYECCVQDGACNKFEIGECTFPDTNFNCDGECIVGEGCDGVCGSGLENDDCGICNGVGLSMCEWQGGDCLTNPRTICWHCPNLINDFIIDPGIDYMYWVSADENNYNNLKLQCMSQCESYCDCDGNISDCNGDCNGGVVLDACGVCGGNDELCTGCTDEEACNYDDLATISDGYCTYPLNEFRNCDGSCISDEDLDGICDGEDDLPDCADNFLDECGVCGGSGSDNLGCGCFNGPPNNCPTFEENNNYCGIGTYCDDISVCYQNPYYNSTITACDCSGNLVDGYCDCDGNIDVGCGCGNDGCECTNCDCPMNGFCYQVIGGPTDGAVWTVDGGESQCLGYDNCTDCNYIETECTDCGEYGCCCSNGTIQIGVCELLDECGVCGGDGIPSIPIQSNCIPSTDNSECESEYCFQCPLNELWYGGVNSFMAELNCTNVCIGDGACDCDGNVDLGCGCGNAPPRQCTGVGSTYQYCNGTYCSNEDAYDCPVNDKYPFCDCDDNPIGDYCDCDGNTDLDCMGVCNGDAEVDDCGICDGIDDYASGICYDCTGTPGNLVDDECGVCDGDGTVTCESLGTFEIGSFCGDIRICESGAYGNYGDSSSCPIYDDCLVCNGPGEFTCWDGSTVCPGNSCPTVIPGCQDETACNYVSDSNFETPCTYPEENFDCNGNCIAYDGENGDLLTEYGGYCANTFGEYNCDEINESADNPQQACESLESAGGGCTWVISENAGYDCAGVCGGTATFDICGICNGPGEFTCWDESTVCPNLSQFCPTVVPGCQDETACNYVSDSNFETPCTYPVDDNHNCDGTCGGLNEADEDCAGECAGTLVVDECGLCGGTGQVTCWDNLTTVCPTSERIYQYEMGAVLENRCVEYNYCGDGGGGGYSGGSSTTTAECCRIRHGGSASDYSPIRLPNCDYEALLTYDCNRIDGELLSDCPTIIPGCQDETACNYVSDSNFETECTYPEENFDCDGNCTVDVDCAGECAGTLVLDECGVCNGPGEFTCWDESTICPNIMGCGGEETTCTGWNTCMEEINLYGSPQSEVCDEWTYEQYINACINFPLCQLTGEFCPTVIPGCQDDTACNYVSDSNFETTCIYAEENYDCGGNCVVDKDCAGVCNGSLVIDDCGICNGPGEFTCWDGSTVCPGNSCPTVVPGCQDDTACNYVSDSNFETTCIYPEDNFDCDGNCIVDIDCAGICNGDLVNDDCGICDGPGEFTCWDETTVCPNNDEFCPTIVVGCMDDTACNYDETANIDSGCYYDSDTDGTCDPDELTGCTDEEACNYNPDATEDDNEFCVYPIDDNHDCNGVCGGLNEADEDCAGECAGTLVLDECGICNGPGKFTCWDESTICPNNDEFCPTVVPGCQDETACNYVSDSNFETECTYPEENFDCTGNCIVDLDCAGICNGELVLDDCEICNGPGKFTCWDESTICPNNGESCPTVVPGCQDETACNYVFDSNFETPCIYAETNFDCDGNCTVDIDCAGVCNGSLVFDDCGICNGPGEFTCWDDSIVCPNNGESCPTVVPGCQDETACNYVSDSNFETACIYPEENYDCSGNCIVDTDCAGVCNGSLVLDDCEICNGPGKFTCWDESTICPNNDEFCPTVVPGCQDDTACNYVSDSNFETECTYSEDNFDCDGNCTVDIDCAGVCNGGSVLDSCGVCNGPGEFTCWDESTICPNIMGCVGEASVCADFNTCMEEIQLYGDTQSEVCDAYIHTSGQALTYEEYINGCNNYPLCQLTGEFCPTVIPGCQDDTACNYVSDSNFETPCTYPEENYDCDGNCIVDLDCAGICNGDLVDDECGICGGNGIPDGFCDCDYNVIDECGECGGTGIADGACDCDGNPPLDNFNCDEFCIIDIDCAGVCGGDSVLDDCLVCGGDSDTCLDCAGVPNGDAVLDQCNVCDGDGSTCEGCMDNNACNHDPDAQFDDGSCTYPEENYDCDGNCAVDIDCNGECNGSLIGTGVDGLGLDCSGNCDGVAQIDDCGDCWCNGQTPTGDYTCNTNENNYDCAGICMSAGGVSVEDECGNCGGPGIKDTNGNCNYDNCCDNSCACPGECSICGCTDDTACNHNGSATYEDGSCYYPQNNYNCSYECCTTSDIECGYQAQPADCAGVCGGNFVEDNCGNCGDYADGGCHLNCQDCAGNCGPGDIVEDCLGICGGDTVEDACGICGGPGEFLCWNGDSICPGDNVCPQPTCTDISGEHGICAEIFDYPAIYIREGFESISYIAYYSFDARNAVEVLSGSVFSENPNANVGEDDCIECCWQYWNEDSSLRDEVGYYDCLNTIRLDFGQNFNGLKTYRSIKDYSGSNIGGGATFYYVSGEMQSFGAYDEFSPGYGYIFMNSPIPFWLKFLNFE